MAIEQNFWIYSNEFDTIPLMSERRPYTEQEFRKAERLRKEGLAWEEVATVLDRKVKNLETMFLGWRRGWFKGKNEKTALRDKRVEEMVEQGMRPGEIAKTLGISSSVLSHIFARLGIDREIREMYRRSNVTSEAAQ